MAKWSNSTGIVVATPIAETIPNQAVLKTEIDLFKILDELPVIHIIVTPTPPLDYVVQINGHRYDATERSEYGVERGRVTVVVYREGRQPCNWSGLVEQNQQVQCRL